MRREPLVAFRNRSFQARKRAPITRLRACEACFEPVAWCRGLMFRLMKTKFEEWRVNNGKLSFCAPVFVEPRVKRRASSVSSNSAHPYAPSVPSRASAKRAQPVVGVQFGEVFGKTSNIRKDFAISKVSGVRVTGLVERFMRD